MKKRTPEEAKEELLRSIADVIAHNSRGFVAVYAEQDGEDEGYQQLAVSGLDPLLVVGYLELAKSLLLKDSEGGVVDMGDYDGE